MQKSANESVQTCAQEPETTAVPRLAHSKQVYVHHDLPRRGMMTISGEYIKIGFHRPHGHIRYVPFS